MNKGFFFCFCYLPNTCDCLHQGASLLLDSLSYFIHSFIVVCVSVSQSAKLCDKIQGLIVKISVHQMIWTFCLEFVFHTCDILNLFKNRLAMLMKFVL